MVCRTFAVDVKLLGKGGSTKTVDLVEGGNEKYVNFENRHEFVKLFIQFDVQVQAQTRCDAFWRGFGEPKLLKGRVRIA